MSQGVDRLDAVVWGNAVNSNVQPDDIILVCWLLLGGCKYTV